MGLIYESTKTKLMQVSKRNLVINIDTDEKWITYTPAPRVWALGQQHWQHLELVKTAEPQGCT